MESKYKNSKYLKRAIEITDTKEPIKHYDVLRTKGTIPDVYMFHIEAMCQLAEEVEKDILSKPLENKITLNPLSIPRPNLYTKEQVEKLLQKQRELCANQPIVSITIYNKLTPFVNCNDILNAKLNIENNG